jgi:phage tail-like protein
MANSAGVTPRSLQQKWQFGVEIAGFDPRYFEKADFPAFEFDETKFGGAGSIWDQKLPGRVKFEDVKLSKAIPQDKTEDGLLEWLRGMVTVAAQTGGVPADFLRDVDLVKYDRAGKEIKRFRLYGAWPKSGKFGEGDGSSSDNDIEEMTLTYQYFDKV